MVHNVPFFVCCFATCISTFTCFDHIITALQSKLMEDGGLHGEGGGTREVETNSFL